MPIEWNNLGTIEAGELWQSFTQTQTKSELFRLTFDLANRYWGQYESPIVLCFRYIGGSDWLPPSPPVRIIPERRGILFEVPFARYASLLGHNRRIFELKKSRRDIINLHVQLEEMIINVPPGEPNSPDTLEGGTRLQPGHLIYNWASEFGYSHKLDQVSFPPFTAITRISSNFDIRVRLYKTNTEAIQDLNRPPYINSNFAPNAGAILDVVLGGNQPEKSLELLPIAIIANTQNSFLVIEKLIIDAGIINLRFDFVG